MMGMKTIYNRMFLNVLCMLFYECLMIVIRKTLQMNIIIIINV